MCWNAASYRVTTLARYQKYVAYKEHNGVQAMQYFHLCRKREDCEIMHTNTCYRMMFVWNNNTPFVLIVCKPNAFTDRDLRVCLKRRPFYLTVLWLCLFGDKQSCPWDRNHADVFSFFHKLPLYLSVPCLCGGSESRLWAGAFHGLAVSLLFVYSDADWKGFAIICRHITRVDGTVHSRGIEVWCTDATHTGYHHFKASYLFLPGVPFKETSGKAIRTGRL